MESATPDRGVLDTGPDLIAVEADYRAGVMSVRAVAAKHGVSEGAVRKWAKNAKPEPWKRDLSEKVREAARAALVRVPVRSTHTAYGEVRTASEREVVDVAARAIVQVVREHRGAIQAGQQMVGMLLGQLQEAAASRDELEETIEADTMGTGDDGKPDYRRRAAMLKAVSLPAHAGVIKDLATAMKHLVGLERQAFGLTDEKDEAPPPPQSTAGEPVQDVDYTELRQAFDKRLGHAAAAA